MVAEVFAGMNALKTAFDIARGIKDLDDATRRNAAVIELQEKILGAQQSHSELIDRTNELEQEVRRLKSWEEDKARYHLREIAPGIVALAIRDEMRNGEPFHLICANCSAAGRKSYLQQDIRGSYHDHYKCNGCGDGLGVDKGTPPNSYVDYEDDFITVRK